MAKPFTNPCLAMAKDGVDPLFALLRAQNAARVAPQPARACLPGAPAAAAATPSTDPWLAAARAQNAERRSMLLASAAHTGSQSVPAGVESAVPPTPNTDGRRHNCGVSIRTVPTCAEVLKWLDLVQSQPAWTARSAEDVVAGTSIADAIHEALQEGGKPYEEGELHGGQQHYYWSQKIRRWLSAEQKYRQMTPADQRKRLCRVRTSIWPRSCAGSLRQAPLHVRGCGGGTRHRGGSAWCAWPVLRVQMALASHAPASARALRWHKVRGRQGARLVARCVQLCAPSSTLVLASAL